MFLNQSYPIHSEIFSKNLKKVCLVTSSYFTRDAVTFAEDQNVMIDLIDGDALHDMIIRSAEKYGQGNYRRW